MRLLLLIAIAPAIAFCKEYGSVRVDEVTHLMDVNTLSINIHAWPAVIGERIPVRLAGIMTPTLEGQCKEERQLAQKARERIRNIISDAKHLELHHIKRDSDFQLLADLRADERSLSQLLVNEGYAVKYSPHQTTTWCNQVDVH